VVSILKHNLYGCDIAHHQLAIAVVFIVAGHMYRNFGIGHNMKEILDAHRPPGGRLGGSCWVI
jgi:photosystem I P700 chlorophyll a apoprotein A2